MRGKAALRSEIRALLAGQTPEQSAERSAAIDLHLRPLLGAGPVLAFWPLNTSEPDLRPLIDRRIAAGQPVGLPRTNWEARNMEARLVTDPGKLTTGRHGITEPTADTALMESESIETVLVPGLAFDALGGRLGRGAGFYDRWLSVRAPRARRVGVAFDVQIVEAVPAEAHDVRVDAVVTESGVLTAGCGERR